jgi:hypothetical protein
MSLKLKQKKYRDIENKFIIETLNIIKEANIWWGLNAYLIKDNFISYLICYGQIF